MEIDPKAALDRCETLMLDMDGTVLDLAFDNFMWLHHVPERYATKNGIDPAEARDRLYAKFREMQGTLDWYCLDHWSDRLGLDIAGLHREQNHRISYLPGARKFLESVRDRDIRVLLVTNSHTETLDIKNEVTGISAHFDAVYSAHSFGAPKEDQRFWHALEQTERFDPGTTLFVDDTMSVLDSARRYGVSMLLEVTCPDTSLEARKPGVHSAIDGLGDLL